MATDCILAIHIIYESHWDTWRAGWLSIIAHSKSSFDNITQKWWVRRITLVLREWIINIKCISILDHTWLPIFQVNTNYTFSNHYANENYSKQSDIHLYLKLDLDITQQMTNVKNIRFFNSIKNKTCLMKHKFYVQNEYKENSSKKFLILPCLVPV